MGGYRVIQTTVVSNITEVRLYEDTIEHIKEQHPEVPIELPSMSDAIGKAVSEPTLVETSHSGSFVFVDSETTNASGDPLRVPVRVIAGTSGRVQSAYFASAETAPERVVWRRA